MNISSIKVQVKNSERVSIFVDGRYSFSLNMDEVLKYKLKSGDELTAADIKKFKKISADGKLRMRALEWLLNRPHSEREFRDYLYRKKVEKDQIEGLINEMTERGYLDNYKFAMWFLSLQTRRSKSNQAIRYELYKKGISRELTEQVMQSEDIGENERLNSLIQKKLKSQRYKNDPLKLMRYLTSQGFNYQLVKKSLESEQIDF